MKITHASLFSGIGGFDLAAEWAGFQNIFACEKDPFCQRVLKYHFPNIQIYDDIKTTDFTKYRGKIDILTGGFPCQPFSVAGRRAGADDDRYLWDEMLRAIREVKPTWVVGENVAGLLSMVQPCETINLESHSDLFGAGYTIEEVCEQYIIDVIRQDLKREGYAVQPFAVPACAVGAPHRRDRVWIVAKNTDRIRCKGKQPEEEPHVGQQWKFGTRNNVRLRGKKGAASHRANTGAESLQQREIGVCEFGLIADTQSTGRNQGRTDCIRENDNKTKRTNIYERIDGFSEKQFITHPECSGWTQDNESIGAGEPKQDIPDWRSFPTQPPVCGKYDGISRTLEGITFPKWRQESIKAYGNAIVPQVALEFFNAIKFELCK